MRKEILQPIKNFAESVRFRLPIPYEAKVIGIESADSWRTGLWNVIVEIQRKKKKKHVLLENVRGYHLAGVNPGDRVKVSREEVIFGEPKIEKIEK